MNANEQMHQQQALMGGLVPNIYGLPRQPQPSQTATLKFTVGRLDARPVRDFLSRTKFEGHKIEFWESSGWLERQFVVKGEEGAVRYVMAALEDWRKRLNETGKILQERQ